MLELYGKHIRNVCKTFQFTDTMCDVGEYLYGIDANHIALARVSRHDGEPVFNGEGAIDIDALKMAGFRDSETVQISFEDGPAPKFVFKGDAVLTLAKIEPMKHKCPSLECEAVFKDVRRSDAMRVATAAKKMGAPYVTISSDDAGFLWLSAEEITSKIEMKVSQGKKPNVRTQIDTDYFKRLIDATCVPYLTFGFNDDYPLVITYDDGTFDYLVASAPRIVQ